jgi:DNA-directed RNA polymerase subunit F
MATSEILGLFTTPEQYQQNQLAQFQNRAAQEVQMSPFQQAALGARTAGYQLGQGIGGALGGTDPQLQLITRRQQLLSQLDQSDPMSFRRVAKMASDAGDQQLAFGIAEAGRKAESELALIQQRTAEKMTSEQRNALAYASQFGASDSIEFKEAYQQRLDQLSIKPEATSQETKNASAMADAKFKRNTPQWNTEFQKELSRLTQPKGEATSTEMKNAAALADSIAEKGSPAWNEKYSTELARLTAKETKQNISKIGVSKSTGEAVYYDEGKNLQYVLKTDPNDPTKQIRSPFTGSVDQTTSNVQQTAGFKQAAGINQNKLDFAKAVEENAFSASDRISLAQSLRELSPKAFTGFAADAKLTASKVASAFGIPTKGGTESEIIDQILGQMTIGSAGQLKGALSDKDVLFLKKTIGTRGLSVNTLLFVADEIERLAAQDRHLNKRINQVTQSGGNLNEVNFEEEKSKSSSFVKKQMSEYRGILKKVANNTATLEEATKARQIRDELGL